MAPLTVVPVVFVCASRSEPLSGDDVTPCNLPVEPLNEAAGVGRFFLSLNGLNDQISPSLSTVKIKSIAYELRYSAIFSARSRYCLHLARIFSFTFSLSVSSEKSNYVLSSSLSLDKKEN